MRDATAFQHGLDLTCEASGHMFFARIKPNLHHHGSAKISLVRSLGVAEEGISVFSKENKPWPKRTQPIPG
jgi:hypothetical protein